MLGTIREKTQGWIAGIILGLITIPFALWGINYYFEGGALNVATVNGKDVSVDSYRRALDAQRQRLTQMLGGRADPRMFESPEFKKRLLDGMVEDILAGADMESAGYRLSDAELVRQIRSAPQFQRDGQFDSKLYDVLVRNSGTDPRGFEQRVRRDVLMRQLESGYGQSSIVTASDLNTLLRLEGQQREASYAVVNAAKLRNKPQVSAADIEQEYKAHPERYMAPERVRIEYVRLSAEELQKTIHIGESDLKQAMSDAGQAATGKEERRASHILIPLAKGADAATEKKAMAEIQALRTKLVGGADFAALAKQNSKDPGSAAKGGDLGFVSRGAMVKEFEQALFALKKPGDLSAPVRTEFGVHLIKLTGVKGASGGKVNAAQVEASLKARKAEERFFDLSEKFHNLVYEQPDSLKPAADALGLKIESSDWFTRAGGGGIAAQRKLVEAAFDPEVLEQHRNSAAIEVGPNALVSLRVLGHEPARQLPLVVVRGSIEQSLLATARRAEAERVAKEAQAKVEAGAALDVVAKEYGLDYTAARVYGRKTGGADNQILDAIFRAPVPQSGKTSSGVVSQASGAMVVFSVKRVVEPDKLPTEGADVAAARRTLEARRGNEYYESYRSGLREKARVKVYKDQL